MTTTVTHHVTKRAVIIGRRQYGFDCDFAPRNFSETARAVELRSGLPHHPPRDAEPQAGAARRGGGVRYVHHLLAVCLRPRCLLGASPRALLAEELTILRRTLLAHQAGASARKLRKPFRPLRPDFDQFLIAELGRRPMGCR